LDLLYFKKIPLHHVHKRLHLRKKKKTQKNPETKTKNPLKRETKMRHKHPR
jgi:hypothetical protein